QTQQQNVEFQVDVPEVSDHREDFELPLGRISGSVTGPGGEPAVGARVTLAPAGGFRSDAAFGGQYAEVETNAAGEYDLVALRPGTYMIASGGAPLLNAGGDAALGRVIEDGIELSEGEWKKDVDLRLSGPGNIEVRVLGADGQPARGASVFFRDSQGRVTEPFNFALTDSVGTFTGRGLGVGYYTVSARVGNVASLKSPVVRIAEGETAKVELRLEPGVILWIKLKDREKQDIRASLQVLDEDGHDWGAMFGIEDLQLLYGEGGFSPTEHRLGPLPPGKYKVIARGEDGKKATKPVRIKAGESERRVTLRLK
ncbi:MAG: carboxypeptidase-like regulatory domain-containing protein, partial [Planctomycetota bacterium]